MSKLNLFGFLFAFLFLFGFVSAVAPNCMSGITLNATGCQIIVSGSEPSGTFSLHLRNDHCWYGFNNVKNCGGVLNFDLTTAPFYYTPSIIDSKGNIFPISTINLLTINTKVNFSTSGNRNYMSIEKINENIYLVKPILSSSSTTNTTNIVTKPADVQPVVNQQVTTPQAIQSVVELNSCKTYENQIMPIEGCQFNINFSGSNKIDGYDLDIWGGHTYNLKLADNISIEILFKSLYFWVFSNWQNDVEIDFLRVKYGNELINITNDELNADEAGELIYFDNENNEMFKLKWNSKENDRISIKLIPNKEWVTTKQVINTIPITNNNSQVNQPVTTPQVIQSVAELKPCRSYNNSTLPIEGCRITINNGEFDGEFISYWSSGLNYVFQNIGETGYAAKVNFSTRLIWMPLLNYRLNTFVTRDPNKTFNFKSKNIGDIMLNLKKFEKRDFWYNNNVFFTIKSTPGSNPNEKYLDIIPSITLQNVNLSKQPNDSLIDIYFRVSKPLSKSSLVRFEVNPKFSSYTTNSKLWLDLVCKIQNSSGIQDQNKKDILNIEYNRFGTVKFSNSNKVTIFHYTELLNNTVINEKIIYGTKNGFTLVKPEEYYIKFKYDISLVNDEISELTISDITLSEDYINSLAKECNYRFFAQANDCTQTMYGSVCGTSMVG